MERQIGEIFEHNGEWYQCVRGQSEEKCTGCFFKTSPICIDLNCLGNERKDHTKVIFKKLEKVGEPYSIGTYIFQRYKVFIKPYIFNDPFFTVNTAIDDEFISIEVKQNKEDMEEKESAMDFVVTPPRLTGDKPEHQLNLKSFDLQKARDGKPVCTRDGRKARIICFDTKGDPCPIIALVEENGLESAYHYDKNGQNAYKKSGLDLMMLPEKKEGWVNIVRGSNGKSHMGRGIFQSKEEAEYAIKEFSDNLIDTIKVSWEE